MIYLLRTPDILVSIMVWCGPLILFITLIIRLHSCNAHRPDRDHLGPIPGWSNVISRKDTCYRRSEDDIRCPIGGNWSYYNGTNRCYKHVATNMTWAEAKRSCEIRGAELASVCDEATNDFLANLTSDPVWIGGYKKWNRWTWTDGTPWGFTAWKDGGFKGRAKNRSILQFCLSFRHQCVYLSSVKSFDAIKCGGIQW